MRVASSTLPADTSEEAYGQEDSPTWGGWPALHGGWGAGDGLAQRGWPCTERMQLKGPEICKRWFYCSKMKLCMVITTLMGFPGGSDGKESACNAGDPGLIPGSEDPLEKGMAAHSSILDWEIPWTEERGGLQSTGFQRIRHE